MTTALLLALAIGAPPQAKAPTVTWHTTFTAGQKAAKAAKKPMLVNFTGSDWCHWCQVLKKEVFDTDDFKKWAKANVILVELDFPQKKKQSQYVQQQNAEIAQKYKVQGYPTIYFLQHDGKILGRSSYMKGGPKTWTADASKQLKEAAKKSTAKPQPRPVPVVEDFPPFVEKTLYAAVDVRGKQAPKLEFGEWLTGKAPETKGKVVLIDFWTTWCGPCKAVIPELNEWAKEFKDDLVIIGLSDEKRATVEGFMKTTPMNYHIAVDEKKKLNDVIDLQGIPHVLVITQDGVVRWQGFPLDEKDRLTKEKLAQIIAGNKKLKPAK